MSRGLGIAIVVLLRNKTFLQTVFSRLEFCARAASGHGHRRIPRASAINSQRALIRPNLVGDHKQQ
jgi:hypothetical protein